MIIMTTENQANVEMSAADEPSFVDYLPTPSPKKTKGLMSWVIPAVIILLTIFAIWGVGHWASYGSKLGAPMLSTTCDEETHTKKEGRVPFGYKGDIYKYIEDGGRVTTVNCMVQNGK